MNHLEIEQLQQQGYKTAPVMRTVLADYDTPLSVYHKVANQPNTYLLESVQGGEKWGRYSIIGLPCEKRLEVRGNQITLLKNEQVIEQQVADDPLAWIEAFQQRFSVFPQAGLPTFSGGLVGYFGYDTVRFVEQRLKDTVPPVDDIGAADIVLMVSEELVVFDNLSGQVHVIVHADLRQSQALQTAETRLNEISDQIRQPMKAQNDVPSQVKLSEQDFQSSFGEEPFKEAVDKIKEYILAGDAMQVARFRSKCRWTLMKRRLIFIARCVI